MKYTYRTQGTCSQAIDFELDENGIVTNVVFYGGCNGNLKGISSLVQGMNASEVIARLKGISCGMKLTSCPDQLVAAIAQVLSQSKSK